MDSVSIRLMALFLLAAAFLGCTGNSEVSDEKLGVVVTLLPQQEFVERIAGASWGKPAYL
jgi:ABC-type Zn uptake system ZnuABC Zn-binding protein ZnuA